MKKIAILTPGFLPVPAIKGGAVEKLITDLIDLNELNPSFLFDVFSIGNTSNKNNNKYRYSRIILVNIPKVFVYIEKYLNFIFRLLNIDYMFSFYSEKLVKKLNYLTTYDYILIENNMYLYNVVLKRYKHKSKIIFHLHNTILGRDKPLWLCNLIANNSFKIITVSKFLTNKFKDITGVNNVITLYNCIDRDFFLNKTNNYNEKNDKIVTFLYVGRFSNEKGLLELVKAFNIFTRNNFNSKLVIVGDDTSNDNYTKKVKKLASINDKIIFEGYVDNNEIDEFYKKSDVVIIPSICDEAFGVTALEAIFFKKPVIASNRGGLPEVVGKNGILIDTNDIITNLVIAMNEMMKEKKRKDLINYMNENFAQLNRFDKKNYLSNFIEILNSNEKD